MGSSAVTADHSLEARKALTRLPLICSS